MMKPNGKGQEDGDFGIGSEGRHEPLDHHGGVSFAVGQFICAAGLLYRLDSSIPREPAKAYFRMGYDDPFRSAPFFHGIS
jgi:hypothetical protein